MLSRAFMTYMSQWNSKQKKIMKSKNSGKQKEEKKLWNSIEQWEVDYKIQ
jgi:hypothetical protein